MMDHLNLHKILITNYKRKKAYYFHKMHKLKITIQFGSNNWGLWASVDDNKTVDLILIHTALADFDWP